MKFLMILLILVGTSQAGYLQLMRCDYEYNSDFGVAGHSGLYKGMSGQYYRVFFPASQYSYCPYNWSQ